MLREVFIVILRKILGLTLIFNSVISLVLSLSILYEPYSIAYMDLIRSPYFMGGLPLFFVALTSVLNVVPAQIFGNVNVRRILFHHYVYGLFSIVIYSVFVILQSLVPLQQGYHIYASLLLYWGLALIIDDVSDISPKIAQLINLVRERMKKISGAIQKVHLVSSLISTYAIIQFFPYIFKTILLVDNALLSIVNSLPTINLSVTAAYGLKISKEKVWIKRFNK